MRAWSLAWNAAEVPLAGMRARVIQVRRTGKGCLSYIVGSEGEAAVIDPSVDPDVYTRIAERNDWRITKVLDTHVHADHLSRSLPLARMTGAVVYLPDQTACLVRLPGVAGRRRHPDRRRDARRAAHAGAFLGEHVLPARRPGPLHWGHAVPRRGGASRLGGGPRGVPARAAALYRSLQCLLALPDEIEVLPGHTNRPVDFDHEPLHAPLGEIRTRVELLRVPEEEFAAPPPGADPPDAAKSPPHRGA